MGIDRRELIEVIEDLVPYDGPHGPEAVRQASEGLQTLVGYLNNATRRPLEHAAAVDTVLANVTAAVAGMDQLLGQLAGTLQRQAVDATLYDDRRPLRSGMDTAYTAADHLAQARADARELTMALATVRACTMHLGNDEPHGNQQ